MQRFEMIGRLGNDLDLKVTENNKKVIEFSLADTKKVNGNEVTTWVNFVAWEGKAETLTQYLRKGDVVYVEGELINQKYKTKEGQDRIKTFVQVNKFQLLPNARKEEPKEKVAKNWSREPEFNFGDMEKLGFY